MILVLNNMHKLISDEYIKFINQLNYPILIVDNTFTSQLGNKKFLKLHALSSKNINKLKDIVIDSNSIKTKKYILVMNEIKIIFSLDLSEIVFENEIFYIISFFDNSKLNKEHEKF